MKKLTRPTEQEERALKKARWGWKAKYGMVGGKWGVAYDPETGTEVSFLFGELADKVESHMDGLSSFWKFPEILYSRDWDFVVNRFHQDRAIALLHEAIKEVDKEMANEKLAKTPTVEEQDILKRAGWQWSLAKDRAYSKDILGADDDELIALYYGNAQDAAEDFAANLLEFEPGKLIARVREEWDREVKLWSDPRQMLEVDTDDVGGTMDMIIGYQALHRLYKACTGGEA